MILPTVLVNLYKQYPPVNIQNDDERSTWKPRFKEVRFS